METPELDARFLIQGILGFDSAGAFRAGDVVLAPKDAQALNAAVERRLAHEPVSRILGWREFYGQRFEITPDVLDPRPETETLADLALEVAAGLGKGPLEIADVGTGSGILIATLLHHLPHASGVATDISPAALLVAERNCTRLGIDRERLSFVLAPGLSGLPAGINLIVSNPPYIPSAEIGGLARCVRDYDPHLALDGGPDGVALFKELANESRSLFRSAWLVLEVGAGQCDQVEAIFEAAGFERIRSAKDLSGHIRAVAFRHCSFGKGEFGIGAV